MKHDHAPERTLDEAEAWIYTDPSRVRDLALAVEADLDDDEARRALRLRAKLLAVIADAAQGNTTQALSSGLTLLPDVTHFGDPVLESRLTNVLGGLTDELGLQEQSLRWLTRSRALAEELGDARAIARSWGNAGVAWSRLGDEERALECYREAIGVLSRAGLEDAQSRHHHNAAISLRALGRSDEALAQLDRCEAIAALAGEHVTMIYVHLERARLSDPASDEALQHAATAVSRTEEGPHAALMAEARLLRARIQRDRGDLNGALQSARDGLRQAVRFASDEWTRAGHRLLSELLEATGQHREALQHLRLCDALERAWETRRRDARLAGLRVMHEVTQLEERNRRLTAERTRLQEANDALEALRQAQRALVSLASHDLRSRLATVHLVAQALELGPGPEALARHSGILMRSAVHMTLQLDNLLDACRLEGAELELNAEPLDATTVAWRALDNVRPLAEGKGLRLTPLDETPCPAFADPGALKRVLENLLSNAIKFSPRRAAISLTLRPDGDRILLLVEDGGPGIPDAERARAFRRFERLSPRPTGGEPSLGLGLYVAHEITARMGGRLTLSTRPEGGCRATVELPSRPPDIS
ncbi:MAG: hypothetical protein H6739_26255 [Alphaproteobacteria bacterium]|nr:hypothetical protein [Alphaproteobacteria bacterium]